MPVEVFVNVPITSAENGKNSLGSSLNADVVGEPSIAARNANENRGVCIGTGAIWKTHTSTAEPMRKNLSNLHSRGVPEWTSMSVMEFLLWHKISATFLN